jgi:ribosome biogenesis protein UTP30
MHIQFFLTIFFHDHSAGNTGMPLKNLVDNVVAIAENAVDKIPRKWANIRSIAIKTPESQSLPFYNKTPEELLRIAEMAGVEPAFKDIPKHDNINDTDEAAEEAEKKRKLAAAVKSPLVRALKKQKKVESDNKKEEDDDDKLEEEETLEKKKGKDSMKANSSSKQEEKKSLKADKEAKKKNSEDDTPKSDKKKRRKQLEDESVKETESPSKKAKSDGKEENAGGDFMASKKFKGSKKGYVFKAGKQGLGYYKDVKPVVDKMVLQALFRSAEQGVKRGRSKSGGKRRGKR